jgi:hypothetical protein
LKVPTEEGVPLTVIVLFENDAVTPDGKFTTEPIPVAPDVVNVIAGEIAVFIHKTGLDNGAPTKLIGVTVIAPVAFRFPQPPVRGIL